MSRIATVNISILIEMNILLPGSTDDNMMWNPNYSQRKVDAVDQEDSKREQGHLTVVKGFDTPVVRGAGWNSVKKRTATSDHFIAKIQGQIP